MLQGVTLRAERGKVTAVLGRNGVGKTTLCRSLTGLTPHAADACLFEGVDTTRLPPHRIRDAGISLVPQGRRIFTSLTVTENLAIAARSRPRAPHRAALGLSIASSRSFRGSPSAAITAEAS